MSVCSRVDFLFENSLPRYLGSMITWVTSCHPCDPSISVICVVHWLTSTWVMIRIDGTGVSVYVDECQSECLFEGRFSV